MKVTQILSHDPTPAGDHISRDVVEKALRSGDPWVWSALLSERYAQQTHRVLLHTRDVATHIRLAATEKYRADQRRWLDGNITRGEWQTAEAEFSEWKLRAGQFELTLASYLRRAADVAHELRGFEESGEYRSALLALTAAVKEHRVAGEAADVEPEIYDLVLWQHLDAITVPTGAGQDMPLVGLIDEPATTAAALTPRQARNAARRNRKRNIVNARKR